jgi:hypothetical protein
MFGFCGVCAAAGVLAGPDNEIEISADAPSSAVQVRARQLDGDLCRLSRVLAGFTLSVESDIVSPSCL